MITTLEPNQVFVFGSNLAGRHGAGAALQAAKQFGARYGVGEGLTGQCYAFPTLDANLNQLPMPRLIEARDLLYQTAELRPQLEFLLTKVGCGLAGFDEGTMRALFNNPPNNLILPEDWR